jgi:hypothetical protein
LAKHSAQASAGNLLPLLVGLVAPLPALRARLLKVLFRVLLVQPLRVLLALPPPASSLRRGSAKPLVVLPLVSPLQLVLPVSASLP